MPPASAAKRRRTGQNAASTKAAQSQLSFRSAKSNRNKPEVEYEPDTKPIKPAKPEVTIKDDSISEPSVDEVKPQASTEPEVALGADVETDSEDDDDDDVEARARAVTQKQIDAYWRKKEEDRLAPRVHQQKLSKTEKILREFDLTGSYGPSIGIGRMQRWKRAYSLGLDPPIEVLALLYKEDDKTSGGAEKSILDELILSSKMNKDVGVEV